MGHNDHFKPGIGKAEIKEDQAAKDNPRVFKIDPEQASGPGVREYDPSRLKKWGEGDYAAIRAKYGPLAATDLDRAPRAQKDSRFHLNSLVKDPLSVQQEEQRVIEEMLQSRMRTLDAEVREKAQREGYEAGRAQGQAEALAEIRAASLPRIEGFQRFLAACEAAKLDIYRANERLLMEMIFRIAKLLALHEIKADKSYVTRLAAELIERVGLKDGVRISISPAEGMTIEEFKDSLQDKMSGLTNLSVTVSDQVSGGGCIVETQLNAIDASIDTQLAGVYASVFGTHDTASPEAGAAGEGAP